MEHKLGIIGHVDHGKTTLCAAMAYAASKEALKIAETKTIDKIIEEQNSIPIITRQIELTNWDVKTGRQNRRERRAKERKSKKK